MQLPFQIVDVMLFVDQDLLQQFARAVVAGRDARLDWAADGRRDRRSAVRAFAELSASCGPSWHAANSGFVVDGVQPAEDDAVDERHVSDAR